jgi:hypothetical protein
VSVSSSWAAIRRTRRATDVVLEHHGDVALARLVVGDVDAVDEHRPGVEHLQAREHPQRGGLPAAAGPEQDHELARLDAQIQRVDRGRLRPRIRVRRIDELDGSHSSTRTCTQCLIRLPERTGAPAAAQARARGDVVPPGARLEAAAPADSGEPDMCGGAVVQ